MRLAFRLPVGEKISADWYAAGLSGGPARAAWVLVVAWAALGCDANSFMPPRPEELRGAESTTPLSVNDTALPPTDQALTPAPARPIELVFGQHDPDEAEAAKTIARNQAGISTVKLKISNLEASDPPTRQAELVREAVTHHPRALIVEPADPGDPKLAEAILAAQGQGIPVVLMGRPLAGSHTAPANPSEAKTKSSSSSPESTSTSAAVLTASSAGAQPVVVVAPPPFGPSARELVAAAISNAKTAQLDPHGEALILINTVGDPFIAERTRAIADALKAAGITRIEEVRFATEFKAGETLFKAHLEADPKLALVFAVDSVSSSVVRQTSQSNTGSRFYVVACYSGEDQIADLTHVPHTAAVAEFTPKRLIQKAITTAIALAQGKDVPRRIELPLTVQDLPGNANFLKVQITNAKEAARQKK
jgi:ABC-type sugar transport system substrate-binding protein